MVWIHGGGWVSGGKGEVANYLKILAGRGYATVGVDYSLAPGSTYPTPVREVLAALEYLAREGERLNVDSTRLVLAGDSAGAQIAAQVANIVSAPSYSQTVGIASTVERDQLKGVVLFCGPNDNGTVNLEGAFGGFLATVLWSYSGTRTFADDQDFAAAYVLHRVTPDFPPAFVSVGNGDPLAPQSGALAEA